MTAKNAKKSLTATATAGILAAVVVAAVLSLMSPATAQTARTATAGTFTDARDGKTYRTVTIGKQTWMAENLNYRMDSSWCYSPSRDFTRDTTLIGSTNHLRLLDSCAKYGRYYIWDVAMTACPAGWRLPDTADWNTLLNTAGGPKVAGTRLKSKIGWGKGYEQTVVGIDTFGFSAMPGGEYSPQPFGESSIFQFSSNFGDWWSATEQHEEVVRNKKWRAYRYMMDFNKETVDMMTSPKDYGYSVRCLKNVRQ